MANYCRTIFGDALLVDLLDKYPVSSDVEIVWWSSNTSDIFLHWHDTYFKVIKQIYTESCHEQILESQRYNVI